MFQNIEIFENYIKKKIFRLDSKEIKILDEV